MKPPGLVQIRLEQSLDNHGRCKIISTTHYTFCCYQKVLKSIAKEGNKACIYPMYMCGSCKAQRKLQISVPGAR